MKKNYFLILFILLSMQLLAQTNQQWKTWHRGDHMLKIVENDYYIWANDYFSLRKINKKTQLVEKELKIPKDSMPSDPSSITSMTVDTSGNIWFTYFNEPGIFKFDNKTKKQLSLIDSTRGIVGSKIIADRIGNLWIEHYYPKKSIHKYSIAENKITELDLPTNASTSDFFFEFDIDYQNNIWIKRTNDDKKLYKYNGVSWNEVVYPTNNNNFNDFSFSKGGKVACTRNYLWQSFQELGIHIYSNDTWMSYVESNTPFLKKNQIYKLVFDDDERLWAATQNGLFYLENDVWKKDVANSSPNQVVKNLATHQQTKWLIYNGIGFKKEDNGVHSDVITPNTPNLPDDVFNGFTLDSKGNRYLASKEKGLFKWNSFGFFPVTHSNLPTNKVIEHIAIDKKEEFLWIALSDTSICKMNLSNNDIIRYDKTILQSNYFPTKIYIDDNNKIWYITYKGYGFWEGNAWSFVNTDQISKDLKYTSITDIFLDNSKKLWIGTGFGPYTYDGLKYQKIDSHDKGDFYWTNGITADNEGNVWIAEYELHKFDGNEWKSPLPPSYDGDDIHNLNYDKYTNALYFNSLDGLKKYDLTTKIITKITSFEYPILNIYCLKMAFEPNGSTWFVSPGVSQYNPNGVTAAKENPQFINVTIFPNPTTNEIFVKGDLTYPVKCELYDVAGKMVISSSLTKENDKISVATLPKGAYILTCFDKVGNAALSKILKE